MSVETEAWGDLPNCNVCLGSTDPNYLAYNIAVSGVVLALVGAVGLIGNVLVVIIYTSPEQRIYSTSIYLAALAVSDFSMIVTAMFLFVLEAWRHHGPLALAYTYGRGAPLIFPLGAIFQTTSVYFCVAVAVDCFIAVVLPRAFREFCCTPKNAKIVVTVLAVLSVLYNIPHFFELRSIDCLQSVHRDNNDNIFNNIHDTFDHEKVENSFVTTSQPAVAVAPMPANTVSGLFSSTVAAGANAADGTGTSATAKRAALQGVYIAKGSKSGAGNLESAAVWKGTRIKSGENSAGADINAIPASKPKQKPTTSTLSASAFVVADASSRRTTQSDHAAGRADASSSPASGSTPPPAVTVHETSAGLLLVDGMLFAKSLQICPTDIRLDALYYTVYYTYMYTTFMAVGPLVLLIVLNIFVVVSVIRKGASEDSDTVSLILVVFLFILCNLTALVVNFLELTLYERLKHVIVYLVDLSNLLVIINATANFFVYLIFGGSFRRSLRNMCIMGVMNRKMKNGGRPASTNLMWTEDETNFMTRRRTPPSSPPTTTTNPTPTPSSPSRTGLLLPEREFPRCDPSPAPMSAATASTTTAQNGGRTRRARSAAP